MQKTIDGAGQCPLGPILYRSHSVSIPSIMTTSSTFATRMSKSTLSKSA